MSWKKFHFACRFLNQKLAAGENITVAQQQLANNYNIKDKDLGQCQHLYQHILAELKESKSQDLMKIYGELNLSSSPKILKKLTHIRLYLLLVSILFIFIFIIYQLFIYPSFMQLIESTSVSTMQSLASTPFILKLTTCMMVLSGILLLLFDNLNKKILNNTKPYKESSWEKFLLSSKVVKNKQQLDATIYSPLKMEINKFSQAHQQQLAQWQQDRLDVTTELQLNIGHYRNLLAEAINKRGVLLLAFLAICIVASVYMLLRTIYSPLFIFGSLV